LNRFVLKSGSKITMENIVKKIQGNVYPHQMFEPFADTLFYSWS